MSRIIKAGVLQAHNVAPTDAPIEEIKKANIDNQMKFVEDAARQGVQVLCFGTQRRILCGTGRGGTRPSKNTDGPTVTMMQDIAKQQWNGATVPYMKKNRPVFNTTRRRSSTPTENTGKYRKSHIPHSIRFFEKFYFRPAIWLSCF